MPPHEFLFPIAAKTTGTAICRSGNQKKSNEDAWNIITHKAGLAALVVDGATGLGDRQYIRSGDPAQGTDAAWYAHEFCAALSESMNTEFYRHLRNAQANAPVAAVDATSVMEKTLGRVRDAFRADADIAALPIPAYAQPSAAAIWFAYTPANRMLTWAGLGDCAGLIQKPSGKIERLPVSWDRDRPDAYLTPLLNAYKMIAPNATDAERKADIMPFLRRARSRMNKPGGYWIYSLEPKAAAHQVTGQQKLEPGEHKILLMSDGFDRLCGFGLYDDASLMTAAAKRAPDGLRELYETLRKAEDGDSQCAKYPRTKKSDDATAVLTTFKVG